MSRLLAAVGVVGLSLAMLLGGMGLQGQEKTEENKDPSPKMVKGKLPTYWTKLGLSATQKEQAYKIKSDYHTKISALEVQLKKLRDEEHAELTKVLTAEQREQLRKLVADKAGVGDAPEKKTEPKKEPAPK